MKCPLIIACLSIIYLSNLDAQVVPWNDLKTKFKTPPSEFRAFYPFQGAAGARYTDTGSLYSQLDKIYDTYGFGGVMVAPTVASPFSGKATGTPGYMQHIGNGLQPTLAAGASPWLMTLYPGDLPYRGSGATEEPINTKPLPAYLTSDYFNQLNSILTYSTQKGKKVIIYDEVGYPSGIANYTTPAKFQRKVLAKQELLINGPRTYTMQLPAEGTLMAVVAMNTATLQRIDLSANIKNKLLHWNIPNGKWKLMVFNCATQQPTGGELDYRIATDYMDTAAVNWFVKKVYEPHANAAGKYFGNTLFQTFFDDVGIFDEEKTWTGKFNEKFKARFGINPATYYPALWENIGPETEAARIAFFDTRAELLADGFPKKVTEWGVKNHIQVSGHCPGNYDPQPVDMNGDPFKFYRAQPIPMADVIFAYPTGRDGFKLVSDGADFYDKPIVAAETFNSFSPAGEKSGYRRLMELYVRGINRLMGSGLQKQDETGSTTSFAEWVGRTSMLLQGGKRVADIAIFYPIADLQSFYRFDAPEFTKDMRWGNFVPYHSDYLAVGEMLLGNVHRDFTFLHPDFLLSEKIKIEGSLLKLKNEVNAQSYKALILPGQTVISLKALQKIEAYYNAGGIVIATSQLPSKAAELAGSSNETQANDKKVQQIIERIFGINATLPMPVGVSDINTSNKSGKAVFISKPDNTLLSKTLNDLIPTADVIFEGNPAPLSGGGMLSYIHKQKDNRDIYYFANSSNDAIETNVEAKGKLVPELWNPVNGEMSPMKQVEYIAKDGMNYTRFPMKIDAISAFFVVSSFIK